MRVVLFLETPIPGARVIDPVPHVDGRGRFMRAWCVGEFAAHGIQFVPLQANMGLSHLAGTLRGLHYQVAPHEEAKLVRCTRGAVFDLLVDLRTESPTFGRWFGTELSADNGRMLFVPPMCAHGYQTLEDGSEILYMASAMYAPTSVRGLRYDDPAVGIQWPLPPRAVSDQDKGWPVLQQLSHRVPT
jgi:dTDP-4-dehydrorhamnose 3,5-epimerase